MEITPQQNGDILTLQLVGRLDATWSHHVQNAISSGIRSGAHRIHLDMEGVVYLSSAGISSLLNAYKELMTIQGEFVIPRCSPAVRSVLELSGLGNLLSGGSILPVSAGVASAAATEVATKLETEHSLWDVHALGKFPAQRCRAIGDPTRLSRAGYDAASCVPVDFPDGSLGIGLGAFGTDFDDCRDRFGEMLAVAGAGACLPTDGSRTPDYIVSEGALLPRFQLLYGLACHGKFSQLLRFEPKAGRGRIGLEEIARTALESAGGDLAVVAMVAEASSLVGATLQRAPVAGATEALFAFPGVRDWFSFTAERAHADCVSVVLGVVGKAGTSHLSPFLRPVGSDAALCGHFHAAAFSYRPVQKGRIDLKETITGLFQNQRLEGVLHLLADWREVHGAGESEFFRGACWVAAAEVAL